MALKSEVERIQKDFDSQVLLLKEANETTKIRLREAKKELDASRTQTDGKNPRHDEALRNFEELKSKAQRNENECKRLQDSQEETLRMFYNEKNKRLKLEKEFDEKCSEVKSSQRAAGKFEELMKSLENKLEGKSKTVSELRETCKIAKENSEHLEARYSQDLGDLRMKVQNYENDITEVTENLDRSKREVLRLNEELKTRIDVDNQVFSKVKSLESSLHEYWTELVNSNSADEEQLNMNKNTRDGATVMDSVGNVCKYFEILYCSLKKAKEKTHCLEQSLQKQHSTTQKCSMCEKRKSDHATLVQDLEEAKTSHRKELDRLQESMNKESLTLKSQAEEMKLKLTSKVILLQSDISELKARQERELNQVNERHKNEVRSKGEGGSFRLQCPTHLTCDAVDMIHQSLNSSVLSHSLACRNIEMRPCKQNDCFMWSMQVQHCS